jgi:hypothetical protein
VFVFSPLSTFFMFFCEVTPTNTPQLSFITAVEKGSSKRRCTAQSFQSYDDRFGVISPQQQQQRQQQQQQQPTANLIEKNNFPSFPTS